ncbi:hypothetical protein E2562_033681 [Oryza meyeriana var. granulata]|uniref:Uncharacterized protein n=1 Tax=Oryza meyeriana var. granulata TaxID=110450 RepID=A0A6G1E8A2_9ORYZ|nr:hypothetical protein E2562_033681 [Oryza meyeriana var. granulata]
MWSWLHNTRTIRHALLGEEVHLYLSAEREPNHVLRNLAEYVRSSDRYHRVIGLELRQARRCIAHLERLIEPYVHMGQIPRIELYGVENVAAPAPAADLGLLLPMLPHLCQHPLPWSRW